MIAWDDPVAKAALVDGLVADALSLLAAFGGAVEETEASRARTAGPGGRPGRRARPRRHWKIVRKVAPDG